MEKARQSVTDGAAKPSHRRSGMVAFFRETWHELKRVRWPNRREVTTYTVVALLVSVVMGLSVWGFDVLVYKLMSLIGLV